LTSKHKGKSLRKDRENILTALAINNYIKRRKQLSRTHFVLQLVKSESKVIFTEIMKNDLDCDLIVYEDLRLNLLGKSCIGITNKLLVSSVLSQT
jgi:hypothetical protein